MEDQNQTEKHTAQRQSESRLKKLGRMVHGVLKGKNNERVTRSEQGQELIRERFMRLADGTLINVASERLRTKRDFTIFDDFNNLSEATYSILSIPERRKTSHILLTQEMTEDGRIVPKLRAVQTWVDSISGDVHASGAMPVVDTEVFDVDRIGNSSIITLKPGVIESTVWIIDTASSPDAITTSDVPEESADRELKVAVERFRESVGLSAA